MYSVSANHRVEAVSDGERAPAAAQQARAALRPSYSTCVSRATTTTTLRYHYPCPARPAMDKKMASVPDFGEPRFFHQLEALLLAVGIGISGIEECR